MADRSNRSSRRGGAGDRSHYDDSSRRDRPSRGGRDRDYGHARDRDQRRDREDDHGRDRDLGRDRDRDKGRDRDRDRNYRRYRSRSRDRRDRRRSRSPGRDRDRRDERPRGAEDRGGRRRDEGRDGHRDRDDRAPNDTQGSHAQPVFPRRSASPGRQRNSEEMDASLPTRSKPATPTVPAAPVSFKVKGQDRREGSHPIEPQPRHGSHDSRDERHQRDEEEHARGRFDDPMEEDDDDLIVEEDGMDAMQTMLGFGGFGTTKNQKVLGNNAGAVRKEKKTEYRQYMNRVGGFNRPLSPTR